MQSVGIAERQSRLAETRLERTDVDAMSLQPFAPEIQAAGRNCQRNFAAQSVTFAARRHLRPGEKSQVRARVTFRIRIEKMVGPGIILVHTFFHEAHPENARIKIQVLLRRPGDGSDVMESVDRVHRAGTIAWRARERYCKCVRNPSRSSRRQSDNSPALQRWVTLGEIRLSPAGDERNALPSLTGLVTSLGFEAQP